MFRNFLYLDKKMLNDYLSIIEGGIVKEREIKTIDAKGKAGEIGFKGTGGKLTNQRTEEILDRTVLTDAGKFNSLHSYMDKNGHIQFLDAFDEEIWNDIKRKEIIEAEVTLRIPKLYEQLSSVGNILPYIGDFQSATGEIFTGKNDSKIFSALGEMSKEIENSKVPVICESAMTTGYKFILDINRSHLNVGLDEFSEEATIIGKVQRIYNTNEKIEVFSLVPSSKNFMNREDRRKMGKSNSNDNIVEIINGLAMKIIPLAIYT